jgi:hypothetical protein
MAAFFALGRSFRPRGEQFSPSTSGLSQVAQRPCFVEV